MSTKSLPVSDDLHWAASDQRPAAKRALQEMQTTLGDLSEWIGMAQQNERDTLCLWSGQSPDYRKWDKVVGKPVAPYDGCSDSRERLIEESVTELTQLEVLAFFTANPATVQQEASDASASGKVSILLKYEMRQRLLSELWDEVNFAAWTKNLFGHSVVETRWKQNWTTGTQKITPEELSSWLAMEQAKQQEALGMGAAEEIAPVLEEVAASTVMEALMAADDEAAVALIQQRFPVLSKKRALAVVRQLKAGETAEFRLPVRLAGRPQVIARTPGIDVFYPWWTVRVQQAPWVAVVDKLSEVELRKMRVIEGWSEEFIEAMISAGPLPAVDPGSMPAINGSHTIPRPMFDDATGHVKRRVEQLRRTYEVVRLFVRAVDEDGIECEHEIVCHPSIGTGYARGKKTGRKDKEDLLIGLHRIEDRWLEGGRFVSMRRGYGSRPLWESMGVAEQAGGYQHQLKKWTDQSIDRNDLAVNPPIHSTHRNAAGKGLRLGIMPGAIIRGDRGEEASYMAPPSIDGFGAETEKMIRGKNARLLGLTDDGVPESRTMNHQQYIVTGALIQWREVLLRILALDQQFMNPLYVERVVGNGPLPFKVSREEIAGQFDVQLTFDVRMLDMEYVKARWNVIKEAYANDRSGVMNDAVLTRWLISSIDPGLADMAVGDPTQVAQNEANDEKMQLAVAAMGVILPPKEGGNAQSRLAAIEEEMQTNQRLQAQYMQDPTFKNIVDARMQKYQFDLTQRNNADIGRKGWVTPEREQEAEEPVLANDD